VAPALDTPTSATAVTNELESNVDILANLPAVDCEAGLTPESQEGPYFKKDSPETTNLFVDGTQSKRLILAGQVLNQDCLPMPGAKIDFWQTDAEGEYDNTGYLFRGHQFTDNKGRYYLETVLPGVYSSRPIQHIHVKVTSLSGEVLTTQLYFPDQPVEGLTVQLEDHGGYQLGIFNFVVTD
jgi:protocatechuate 3,4-dioxygenase beta subunit